MNRVEAVKQAFVEAFQGYTAAIREVTDGIDTGNTFVRPGLRHVLSHLAPVAAEIYRQLTGRVVAENPTGKEVNEMARGGTYEAYGGGPATPNEPVPSIPRCPLIKLVNMVGFDKYYGKEDYQEGRDDECWGEDCGFWNPNTNMCGIASLGEAT